VSTVVIVGAAIGMPGIEKKTTPLYKVRILQAIREKLGIPLKTNYLIRYVKLQLRIAFSPTDESKKSGDRKITEDIPNTLAGPNTVGGVVHHCCCPEGAIQFPPRYTVNFLPPA